jgi:hypothetical protein
MGEAMDPMIPSNMNTHDDRHVRIGTSFNNNDDDYFSLIGIYVSAMNC